MPLVERRIDDRLVLLGKWFRKAGLEHPAHSVQVLLYYDRERTWRLQVFLVGNVWKWLYATIVTEDFSVSMSDTSPDVFNGRESLNVTFNETIAGVSSIELLPPPVGMNT